MPKDEKVNCKDHGAYPVEYEKRGSDFRAYFCGGASGCRQDCEKTDTMVFPPKPLSFDVELLEFGCYIEASLYEMERFRVVAQASICRKGHKMWATCGEHDCDDFDNGLFVFNENDNGFYTMTIPHEKIYAILCPPDCLHYSKSHA